MESKPWWMSRTVITNLLMTIITVAGSMTEVIPDKYDKYLVMVVSAANIGLRLISSAPVHVLPQK